MRYFIFAAFGVEFERNHGFSWWWEQFYAMIIKRLIHSMRNKVVTIVQLLIPLIFVVIGCIIINTIPGESRLCNYPILQ